MINFRTFINKSHPRGNIYISDIFQACTSHYIIELSQTFFNKKFSRATTVPIYFLPCSNASIIFQLNLLLIRIGAITLPRCPVDAVWRQGDGWQTLAGQVSKRRVLGASHKFAHGGWPEHVRPVVDWFLWWRTHVGVYIGQLALLLLLLNLALGGRAELGLIEAGVTQLAG